MGSTSWTFTVLFATIFAILLIFAVVWLTSQGPIHREK